MHDGTWAPYLPCGVAGWQGGSPVREYGGSDDDSDGEAGARKRSRQRIGDDDEQSGTMNTDRHQNTLDTLRPASTAFCRTETLAYPGTDQTLSQIPATVSTAQVVSWIVVARRVDTEFSHHWLCVCDWCGWHSLKRAKAQAERWPPRRPHLHEEEWVAARVVAIGPTDRPTHRVIYWMTCNGVVAESF